MQKYFYTYCELKNWLSMELEKKYDEEILDDIVDRGLIVSLNREQTQYFIEKDVYLCKKLLEQNYKISDEIISFFGFRMDVFFDITKITDGTFLKTHKGTEKKRVPAYIRNLLFLSENKIYEKTDEKTFNLPECTVVSDNLFVIHYLDDVKNREGLYTEFENNDFANTSTYMGIKKNIIDFVMESIIIHYNPESVFVDLMCGSGSVANIFSKFGTTYASDSQLFCTLLAKVQGKGISVNRALEALTQIYYDYLYNMEKLKDLFGESIITENNIFHMDLSNKNKILDLYTQFVNNTQLYSSTDNTSKQIQLLVDQRKQNHKSFPYCLFTTYFSNIYFGMEQSFQIDSIRYAIEQFEDKQLQDWMTGVLIITASVVASNYGGHFAQPKKICQENLESILDQRKKSVWLEFSRRLMAIAEESEKRKNSIHIIPGPWQDALAFLKARNIGNALVYVDAPYKRDDYSRYYHVLETLARYDYPDSEYKSRTRSISKGERFRSEFSTRNVGKVENQFVFLITEVSKNNYVCAWSYSNNGSADMMRVIEGVLENKSCNVYIYAVEHRHMSQGKKRKERVRGKTVEYCIVFKAAV